MGVVSLNSKEKEAELYKRIEKSLDSAVSAGVRSKERIKMVVRSADKLIDMHESKYIREIFKLGTCGESLETLRKLAERPLSRRPKVVASVMRCALLCLGYSPAQTKNWQLCVNSLGSSASKILTYSISSLNSDALSNLKKTVKPATKDAVAKTKIKPVITLYAFLELSLHLANHLEGSKTSSATEKGDKESTGGEVSNDRPVSTETPTKATEAQSKNDSKVIEKKESAIRSSTKPKFAVAGLSGSGSSSGSNSGSSSSESSSGSSDSD